MKKIYLEPETIVYKVNVASYLATSFDIQPDPIGDNDFEQSREDNTDENNNRGSVWDNAW